MPNDPDHGGGFMDPDKTDTLPIPEATPVDAEATDGAVPVKLNRQTRAAAARSGVAAGQAAPHEPGKQHAAELRALADALISRDATILEMLETLDERVAELAALRSEQGRAATANAIAGRGGGAIDGDGQQELRALRAQAAAYLELLQTREWRREFQMSLFLARDDAVADAPDAAIRPAPVGDGGAAAPVALGTELAERASIEALTSQNAALLARVQSLQEAAAERDVQLKAQALDMANARTETAASEEQMTVLLAHLHEARRSLQDVDAERRRLEQELAVSTDRANKLAAENRELLTAIEEMRTPELPPASGPAAAKHGPAVVSAAAGAGEEHTGGGPNYGAELLRIDGSSRVAHRIGPRSRIGRAPDCELRIDLPSVSRHHALVLIGSGECIIEDLRSTNGTFVNGRMIERQSLNDGDLVTIGEAQLRFVSGPAVHRPA